MLERCVHDESMLAPCVFAVAEKNRLEMLRKKEQQRKDEGPETQTPAAAAVDAPAAVEASPAEPLGSPPVSMDFGFFKEAPKALAGDGAGVAEVSLPPEIASEVQKITQAVSEVNLCP
jgi:hypothetical protein